MKRPTKRTTTRTTQKKAQTVPKYLSAKVKRYNTLARQQEKLYNEIQSDIAKVNGRRR